MCSATILTRLSTDDEYYEVWSILVHHVHIHVHVQYTVGFLLMSRVFLSVLRLDLKDAPTQTYGRLWSTHWSSIYCLWQLGYIVVVSCLLSTCVCVHPFTCLLAHLSVCLSVCLVCLFYLSILAHWYLARLSIHLLPHLLSVSLLSLYLHISLSVS